MAATLESEKKGSQHDGSFKDDELSALITRYREELSARCATSV
ncbi:MAG: hypothetical protein R3B49_09495 [Phycisphaerales bacterium]